MKYRGNQTNMWDAWFLNVEGRVHAFHLQLPRKECTLPPEECQAVGHIYSDDLIHWTRCQSILPPLFDQDERDYHQKFTGCADQIDGKYIIYYTMRDKERGSQRLGAAISKDLINFSLYENNPVIVPDDKILIGFKNLKKYDWNIVDCRDLITVKCNEDGLYYGYFAAAADVGRKYPVGVIAVAVSDDLINWRNQSIVYIPRQNGAIEVPDVYEIEGKWYLTTLNGTGYIGRYCGNDEYAVCCTTYAVADNPRGPFVDMEDNIFISGNVESGYTCRSVVKDGKRYLLYVDRSYGGGTLSLPKEIRVNEKGELGAYYADILKSIRINTLISPGNMPEPEYKMLPQTSFAWRTFGGEWTKEDNKYICKTEKYDYQAIDFNRQAHSIEAEAEFTINGFAGGFYVFTNEAERAKGYVFSIEPEKNRLLLSTMHSFEFINARAFNFERNKKYKVKLIMIEGVCEVYVDNKLIMQCGIEMFENTSLGLFCDRGETVVKNLYLYELEHD